MNNFIQRAARKYFANETVQVDKKRIVSSIESALNNWIRQIKSALRRFSVQGQGYAYNGLYAEPPSDYGLSEAQKLILESLQKAEGCWTAINTWDNQIFTFGIGISRVNMPFIWKKLYANEALRKDLREKVGVNILENGFVQIRPIQNENIRNFNAWYKDVEKDNYSTIRNNRSFLQKLVDLFEQDEYFPVVQKAELDFLTNPRHRLQIAPNKFIQEGALYIPEEFRDWPIESQMIAAHLTHWLPTIGWFSHKDDYKGITNGLVADVIRTAYSLMTPARSRCTRHPKDVPESECANIITYMAGKQRINNYLGGNEYWDALCNCPGTAKTVTLDRLADAENYPNCLLFQLSKDGKDYLCVEKLPVKIGGQSNTGTESRADRERRQARIKAALAPFSNFDEETIEEIVEEIKAAPTKEERLEIVKEAISESNGTDASSDEENYDDSIILEAIEAAMKQYEATEQNGTDAASDMEPLDNSIILEAIEEAMKRNSDKSKQNFSRIARKIFN